MRSQLLFFVCTFCFTVGCVQRAEKKTDQLLPFFVGTYTQKMGHVNGKATGIYACVFDPTSGKISLRDSVTDIENPSFLAISPNKQFVFAVSELGGTEGQPFGTVVSYTIQADGQLKRNNEVSSLGIAPCHISTDLSGNWLFVANYGTGNICSYRISVDGILSEPIGNVKHKGVSPWAHMILPSPDGAYIWAVDKGVDSLFRYSLAPDGQFLPSKAYFTGKGRGPRHLAFHPVDPNFLAVVAENSSEVLLFKKDSVSQDWGIVDSISSLPAGFSGSNSGADIHFHPSGHFLFASNRGHNSIVTLSVNTTAGKLQLVGHTSVEGEIPRNFALTPSGDWLLVANQNSGTISTFKFDTASGLLGLHGTPFKVATPVCIQFLTATE